MTDKVNIICSVNPFWEITITSVDYSLQVSCIFSTLFVANCAFWCRILIGFWRYNFLSECLCLDWFNLDRCCNVGTTSLKYKVCRLKSLSVIAFRIRIKQPYCLSCVYWWPYSCAPSFSVSSVVFQSYCSLINGSLSVQTPLSS